MPTPVSISVLGSMLALALWAGGCEKADHESLDHWRRTEHGPQKLLETLRGKDHPPDIRAHAGRNLILMDRWGEVRDVLDELGPSGYPVVASMAGRLWEDARIAERLQVPTPEQNVAKDALYELRRFGDEATMATIDGYLVEWLTGYYPGRANQGRVSGKTIIRAVGPAATEGLLASARSVIAAPQNADGSWPKIGDELLLALGLSASPDATAFVLDLATTPSKDDTLHERAIGALYAAYVELPGLEPAAPAGLAPHVGALGELIRAEDATNRMKNDAVALIAAVGPPHCLTVFADMVSYPHASVNYRWMGAQRGIRCGGVPAVRPIVEALPPAAAYDHTFLDKYVWAEILSLDDKAKVAAAAEALLQSDNWVARVTAVEVLGRVGLRGRASFDAEKIRGLGSDKTVLRGWWGKDKGKKAEPTLGERATEVARELDKVAKKG